jgi:hypothetical protein
MTALYPPSTRFFAAIFGNEPSALAGAGIYDNEAAGRAAVGDGYIFAAISATTEGYIDLWKKVNASSSTLLKTYPSLAAFEQIVEDAAAELAAASVSAITVQEALSILAVQGQQATSTSALVAATNTQIGVISTVMPGVVFPTTAASNVPRGVSSVTISAAGSGGTNGTFALAWSGGNFSANPVGTFTVSGGAVTAITIAEPGLYIGASPTAPTPVFSASSGLTGASGTPVVAFRVPSGSYYWARNTDGLNLDLYLNVAGTATVTSPLIQAPLSAVLTNLAGSQVARTTSNSEGWRAGREQRRAIDHTISTEWDFYESLKVGESIQLFAQDGSNSRIHLCWDTTRRGFAEGGILTEITLRTGRFLDRTNTAMPTTTGAKVQMWIMRPSATLPTTASSVTVSKIAAIGEATLPDSQSDVRDDVTFTGLNIPVQAGDVPAFRVINAGIRFASTSGGTTEYDAAMSLLITDTDLDIATALGTSKTATAGALSSSGNRRFFHKATIVKNDHQASHNTPRGYVKLNAQARIPAAISRDSENAAHALKIAVTGSSISTWTGGGTGAIKGHIPMAMEMLQCDWDNFAVGGGFGLFPTALFGSAVSQHITGTEAEFVTLFGGSDPGQYSYQRRLIGQGYDICILPDMINDTNAGAAFSIGVKGNTSPATLWGGLSRLIEALIDDNCLPVLQTPAHRWATYSTPGTTPTEQANRILWADAMEEIANWYSIPIINYIKRGGIGPSRVKDGTGLIDTIHPAETNGPKPQMAQLVYDVISKYRKNAPVI